MSNIATIEPRPKSVLVAMADHYGMEPAAFEATVRATCIKPDKTGRVASKEEFAAFLLVAKQYGLNPLTKEIFAFTDRGGVVPIVSVDGWANLINSHPKFDGMDFEDAPDASGLASITCRMHRKDRSHPVCVTEYMVECKRPTEPWQKWPRRMLRHKAMIQAARYAFGFAGIYDEDEGERIVEAKDVTPARRIAPPPPPPPPPARAASAPEPPEPKEFDFDAFRAALDAAPDVEAMNAAYEAIINAPGRTLTGDETDECDRIAREIGAKFWQEEEAAAQPPRGKMTIESGRQAQ